MPNDSCSEFVPDNPPNTPLLMQNIRPDGDDAFQQALLYALQAMYLGDFSIRLPGNQTGLPGKIADTFNDIAATNQRMAQQLEHVGTVVGREGQTRNVPSSVHCMAPGTRWKPR